jgi:phosphoribosylformimino-5-aminoimidazole carboxamide ribotide isomerase
VVPTTALSAPQPSTRATSSSVRSPPATCTRSPLDARSGEVATDGWTVGSGRNYLDAAREVTAAGASRILFTSIAVDGTLSGPDLPAIRALQQAATVPIIASGGVGSVEHLEALAETGVESVIVGRALYEGTVPAEAVSLYSGA